MLQILCYIKHAILFKLSTVDCYSYFLKQGNWDSSKSNSHYIEKKKKFQNRHTFTPKKHDDSHWLATDDCTGPGLTWHRISEMGVPGGMAKAAADSCIITGAEPAPLELIILAMTVTS